MMNTRRSDRALFGVSALAFVASAVVTVIWCGSMSAMPGMEMPGGWTMSMAWMRMPGQSWFGAAATFLGMWTVMMIAMMLPVLVPVLARYRRSGASGRQTVHVATSYFGVWTLLGVAAYPMGVALAELSMRHPELAQAVPIATGAVVIMAGALQLTAWKARQLDCCREASMRAIPANADSAFEHGIRAGLDCVRCCAGLTSILLVSGVMDLRAMAVVAAAIAAERLLPSGKNVAHGIGAVTIAAGLMVVASAVYVR